VPAPLSDRKRNAILADIEAGQKSRNQIARDHKVSVSSVTKLAPANAFDRSQTKKATAAKQVDHKARLVVIAGRTASVAEDVLTSFEDMTTEDWRKVSPYSRGLIVGIMADKSRELAPDDSAAEEISSLLGGLLGQLKTKHGDAPPE
jgi:hypothetical protein